MTDKSKIIKKIGNIKVESFKSQLLEYINSYLYASASINIKDNSLVINKTNGSSLKVTFKKDIIIESVVYEIKDKNESKCGKYLKYSEGCYIEEKTTHCNNHYIDDLTTLKNVECEQVFRFFDKKGIEQNKSISKKVDNHFINNQTGKITLREPNIHENYIENIAIYRKDDYLLKNVNKIYVYPDKTPIKENMEIESYDYYYVMDRLIEKNVKEIPDYAQFYDIDEDIFKGYLSGILEVSKVKENVKSKKYTIPDEYII